MAILSQHILRIMLAVFLLLSTNPLKYQNQQCISQFFNVYFNRDKYIEWSNAIYHCIYILS